MIISVYWILIAVIVTKNKKLLKVTGILTCDRYANTCITAQTDVYISVFFLKTRNFAHKHMSGPLGSCISIVLYFCYDITAVRIQYTLTITSMQLDVPRYWIYKGFDQPKCPSRSSKINGDHEWIVSMSLKAISGPRNVTDDPVWPCPYTEIIGHRKLECYSALKDRRVSHFVLTCLRSDIADNCRVVGVSCYRTSVCC